jgi:hypothetical protein
MRIYTCILAAIAISVSAHAGPMTEIERSNLVAHLEMTASWIETETAHLSTAQLTYHAAPEKWSVIDVLEHLNIAEPIYWSELNEGLKQPLSEKKSQVPDAPVLWYGIDRSQKDKTEARKVPHSTSTDVGARLEAFRKLHAEMLDYVRSTNDDLRGRLLTKEQGVDLYQWILEISAHTQRHILQIREVKASPGFPKS